ncbi:hypothetical protein ANCDUO_17516 [Ancylostoma duodenale]|uniref:EF-hand domain-containing protein n=1 Tax=Ancylostoma duodenale TaxID=51022 RepID=A0A0C2C7X5_9BILA|nr:hypothetical protein ANCDUO_17516 [Ancylostoma duodenale]
MNLEDLIDMFPDIEPFLIRKWHYAFYTFFDLIGNDVIEWRDFQQLIDAIGAVRGVGGEDHIAARISLTMFGTRCVKQCIRITRKRKNLDVLMYEEESLLVADHAGGLDRDVGEFTHSREGAGMAEGIPRLHVPAPRCIWQNPAGGQFNSIDYKRFLSLWQQYFRSTDINDVGNHLLGTP